MFVTVELSANPGDDKGRLQKHLEQELAEGWVITQVIPLGVASLPAYQQTSQTHPFRPRTFCWVAVTLTRE